MVARIGFRLSKARHSLFRHLPLLWVVSAVFYLCSGLSLPAYAAPPGQGDDVKAQAYALLREGVDLYNQGDFQGALEKLQTALPLLREVNDLVGEAAALGNIGAVYVAMGQQEQALNYLEQALIITRQVGDRLGEAFVLNSIGGVYYFLSDYPRALDYLQQALAAHSKAGDRNGEATTLVNIGTIYYEQDRLQPALAHFQQALPVLRDVGDRSGEANALNHIGGVYQSMDQLPRALDYFQQALAIYREIGARQGEGQLLNNMGHIYHDLDQPEGALEYFEQALTIFREIGDRWAEAGALSNLGVIYGRLGQPQKAMAYYEEALPLRRAIGDRLGEATTLNNLGTLSYPELGRPQQALAYFQQALPIVREVGDRQGEVITLDNIGIIYLDLGQPAEALAHFRQSIEVIESIRSSMGIEELKSGFAARYAGVYETMVPLLIELDQPEEAFAYAERARARAFLDQLGNVRVDPRQDADPVLVESEQQLANEIADLDRRLRELIGQPTNPQTDDMIADLRTQLAAKRAEYADLLIQLKLSNPAYADLISVDPLTLEQIQTKVLPENTTLISYFVADEQTTAFVVSRDSFAAVPIAITRQDLTGRVAAFRSLLTLEAERPADRLADDRFAAAQALHNILLAPLASYLPSASTSPDASRSPHPSLIIAPHDALHYLPFAALLDGAGEPLSARFTLSLIPSASALNYAQANQNPDHGRLLALGNPVTDLLPLPYAGREVEALSALYPLSTALTGPTATEVGFRAEVSRADWVHLAAHAQLNPATPLFSALYLAEGPATESPQDVTGSPATSSSDGRLEVREIFNLDLAEANGVVLSACETGLGEQSRGDELVGLTRAFLYAGTPVVVASLWEVEDEATAALMTTFHQHLRAGLGPAAALRAAQEGVRQDSRWSAPYYWAGFQVIGDGGPSAGFVDNDKAITPVVSQPGTPGLGRWEVGLAGLLALLGLAMWWLGWRRRGRSIGPRINSG